MTKFPNVVSARWSVSVHPQDQSLYQGTVHIRERDSDGPVIIRSNPLPKRDARDWAQRMKTELTGRRA